MTVYGEKPEASASKTESLLKKSSAYFQKMAANSDSTLNTCASAACPSLLEKKHYWAPGWCLTDGSGNVC